MNLPPAAECPGDVPLEQYLLAPERSTHAAHLQACALCAARLGQMTVEGSRFRTQVFPRTIDAVLAAGVRRTAPRWLGLPRWLWLPLPLAAAFAVFLILPAPQVAPDYVGAKGAPAVDLAVFTRGPDGVSELRDGQAVPAGALVRFRVRASQACRLWLLSLDGSGQVSRLYPVEGEPMSLVGTTALPGNVVLDGSPGPERVFAVCSSDPLAFSELEAAARSVGAGEARVRQTNALPGLPVGAAQTSVLLEKVR